MKIYSYLIIFVNFVAFTVTVEGSDMKFLRTLSKIKPQPIVCKAAVVILILSTPTAHQIP